MSFLFQISIFYFLSNSLSVIAQSNFCVTPNGDSARCIPIQNCPKLLNIITKRNHQLFDFLKNSQCNSHISRHNVCCGRYDRYQSQDNEEGTNYQNPNYFENPNEFDGDSTSYNNAHKMPSIKNKLTSICGFQTSDRILDGEKTDLREFPWMALLQYRRANRNLIFACGGTLITDRYVLTAAHCVQGPILNKIGPLVNVRLGEYNTETIIDCSTNLGFEICNESPVNSAVEKTIPHPQYKENSADRYNDIALVKLAQTILFTEFIKPICLPSGNEKIRTGEQFIVAGWGRTEYASNSPVKLKLKIPLADKSQCSAKFRSAGVSLGKNQLCAGGQRGRDSCNGDSGGPLMTTLPSDNAQWYIEGIVSFGAKCGSQGWPGIYTKVSPYINWIENNMK